MTRVFAFGRFLALAGLLLFAVFGDGDANRIVAALVFSTWILYGKAYELLQVLSAILINTQPR